jgi:hypothetical protein
MKQHIVENPPPKPFGSEIPTDVAEHFAQAEVHPQPHKSLADKAAEALSGGQYGTMSDFIYGGEHPQGFMEKAENIGGQLIENAAALPVMGPIAETSAVAPYIMEKAPVLREALDVSDKAIAGGLSKAKEVTEPLYEHLKPIVAFAKNLPAKVLGTTSGVIDSKALNMAYDIGKSGDKALQKIFEEAKNVPIVNRMVYNYGRSHGLPPDVAAIAEDMTKGVNPRGLGTHDLYAKLLEEGRAAGKKLHEIFPKYENYKDLNIPRALQEQYAKAAGIDVGSWLPQKNLQKGLAGINAGSSLGIGNIGHYLGLLGKFATNLKLAPVLAAQSPKVVGSLAYNAGRLNRLVKGAVPLATDIAIPMAKRIAPFAKQAYEAIPESMLDTATFTTIDPNNPNSVLNQKEGGLLGKFKKKTKGYAEGGKPSLDDVALSVERAKQNIADTYDTAKDIVANPTPYLNRFRQIGSSLNDPAEPISHYLHGDISGGIARANEAFMDRSPEEIASGFAMPSGLGIVGSIENASTKIAKSDFVPRPPPKVAPSINELRDAFDNAIAKHNSLSLEDQIANSKAADKIVGSYLKDPKADLLTKNAKLMKSETGVEGKAPIKIDDGRGVETTGLSLFPAYEQEGFQMCPNSKSCKEACLGLTSGGNFRFGGAEDLNAKLGPRLANYNKTMALLNDPEAFATKLHGEILSAKEDAAVNGNKLGVRLNTLSDLPPKVFQSLMEAHPDVQFYDYTKLDTKPLVANHHITYSSTGIHQKAGYNGLDHDVPNIHQNWANMRRNLDRGDNVAMAFTHKDELPSQVIDEETGNVYKVVDGDSHDFRPLDRTPDGEKGVIVGLGKKADNMGHMTAADQSKGFLVHYDPQYMRQGNKPKGKLIRDENGKPIKTNDKVVIPTQPKPQSMRKIIPIAGE